METESSLAKTANPSTAADVSRTACATWLMMLLLLTLPAAVQAQFNFTTNNGAITITGYTGSGGAVNIPSTTNGYPVTSIVSCQFRSLSSITAVTIPDSVTNIGFGAFESFAYPGGPAPDSFLSAITVDTNNPVYGSLDGVLLDKIHGTLIQYPCGKAGSNYIIPNSVTNIANDAFYYCTNLGSVTITGNVTNIGAQAFQFCISLTNATIGDSVTSIGANAFSGTTLTSVTIGTNVTSVGAYAFNGTRLTSVTIPNSVTSIGRHAFYGCYVLTNVTIGESVTDIGAGAFLDTSLTSVTIHNSVTSIGLQAFYGCTSLTNLTIGNSVTSIGTEAVAYCSSLTQLTFPSSVTSIGDDPFVGCSSLMGLYFRGNAPSIGSNHFSNESSAIVYYLPGTTGWGSIFGDRPTELWFLLNPLILNNPSFGVQTNAFGFIISWATNIPVVVEACADLTEHTWSPVSTNTLTNGSSYFNDPQWTNYPARFYRLRSP